MDQIKELYTTQDFDRTCLGEKKEDGKYYDPALARPDDIEAVDLEHYKFGKLVESETGGLPRASP